MRVYWDSAAFIAHLQEEEGRAGKCADVLQAADQGDIQICTSTLTLAEVVRGKNLAILSPERSNDVSDLFAALYIELVGLDRVIAERARNLCWECGTTLKAVDAIHVASAIEADVREFHSFNGKLNRVLELQDRFRFKVGEPRIRNQILPFTSGQTDSAASDKPEDIAAKKDYRPRPVSKPRAKSSGPLGSTSPDFARYA